MADQNHAENNKAVANLLLKKGLATKEQIQKAIAHQKKSDKNPPLLRVLVGMKVLDKETAQKVQASMKKPKSQAPAASAESAQPSTGGFSFVDDDAEVIAREKKAGNLGVQMFDGNADITGIDLAEDDSDKIMKKKADYFEPVEAIAKKKNKGQAQAKKKKKPINPDDLKCQNCGAKVKENQRRCRECGMPLDLDDLRSRPQDLSKKSMKMYIVPAIVLIAIVIGIVVFLGDKKERDEEKAELTAKEKEAKRNEKLAKQASAIRSRVDGVKEMEDGKDKYDEAKYSKQQIVTFCEKNDYPATRFEAQLNTLNRIIEEYEKEQERIKKEKEAKDNKKDDDEGDDDDTDVDDDDEGDDDKPKELSPTQKKNLVKFHEEIANLFDLYEPGWEKPSNEYKKATEVIRKATFSKPIYDLIDMIIDDKDPFTELPEVTKEDGRIIAEVEPWGFCLNLIITNAKRYIRTDEWKEKAVQVYEKYLPRYPKLIFYYLKKSIGEEYWLRFSYYIDQEITSENEDYLRDVEIAKGYIVSGLFGLDDEYADEVAKVLKPLLISANEQWAKKALDWFLANKPLYAIEDVVAWLDDEDVDKRRYGQLRLRQFGAKNDDNKEILKKYAEAILKTFEKNNLPDDKSLQVLLNFDKDLAIGYLEKIMQNPLAIEKNYMKSLTNIIFNELNKVTLEYFPPMIKNQNVQLVYRQWLLKTMMDREGDAQLKEIMDVVFELLKDENDRIDPLSLALEMLAKAIDEEKVDKKDYWAKFKVYYDNHNRKDCFSLLMAMDLCDPAMTLEEARVFLGDDKAEDSSRAKILAYYAEHYDTTDDTVLDMCNRIEKATTKPGPKTMGTIEMIKVDLLFKVCDNKDFEKEGTRLNQAAVSSPFSSVMSMDKNAKVLVIADQGGQTFRYYVIKTGAKVDVSRKLVSEAWPAHRKELEKWEKMDDKKDLPKPLPPPGEECNYKEQIIQASVIGTRVRFLTSACKVEYWDLSKKSLKPAEKEAKESEYCANIVDLSQKISELQGITLTAEMISSSEDGNVVAIQIAGYEVLVVDIVKNKLLSRLKPQEFKKMRMGREGEYILFYGGEMLKTRVYQTDGKKNVIIDQVMDEEDYASFGAESDTVLVSHDGRLIRFDAETGEKKEVYIVPSLKIDADYFTFILDDGRYFCEIWKNSIRVRQIDEGKMVEAVGKVDDVSYVANNLVVVSGNGKYVAFMMRDGSVLIYKVG